MRAFDSGGFGFLVRGLAVLAVLAVLRFWHEKAGVSKEKFMAFFLFSGGLGSKTANACLWRSYPNDKSLNVRQWTRCDVPICPLMSGKGICYDG